MRHGLRNYRTFRLDVPREEVEKLVAEGFDPAKYSTSPLNGPASTPDVDDLAGKTLAFRGEEKNCDLRVTGLNELFFSEEGEPEKKCWVNVRTMDHEVYFLNFLVPGYAMSRQITMIADMVTGCATIVDAHVGTPNSNIDVDRDFWFGRLEGDFAGGELHGFTTELLGKSIVWDYGNKPIRVKHIYTCDVYYTYVNRHPEGFWMASNPADYVKIRDGLYLFSFIEERQLGIQAIFLIDLKEVRDIGCFYGVGSGRLSSACVGVKGTLADPAVTIADDAVYPGV